jgi:hypothetical protein
MARGGGCRELLLPPEHRHHHDLHHHGPAGASGALGSRRFRCGLRTAGTWLAETADAHLQERAQTGRPSALPWLKDWFRVLVTDTTARPEVTHEIEVRGMASGLGAAR